VVSVCSRLEHDCFAAEHGLQEVVVVVLLLLML
jgi:hypothetical protein